MRSLTVVVGRVPRSGPAIVALLLLAVTVNAAPRQLTPGVPQQPPPAGTQPAPEGTQPAPPSGTQPAGPAGTATAPATQSPARIFASDAGMIFNAIRPDKVADFEWVLTRLKEALAASTDPVRQKQAAGWRIFKAAESGPSGSVLYVFVMEPAVKGADYGVARVLAEAFPEEVLELYQLYNGAFAGGQTLLNLAPVAPVTVRPTGAAPNKAAPGTAPSRTPPKTPPPTTTPPTTTPPTTTPPSTEPPTTGVP